MFNTVKFIRDAFGIESTWAFVLLIAIVFGMAGGVVAWIVDRGYRKTLQASQHATILAPSEDKTERAKAAAIKQLSALAEEGEQLLTHGKGVNVDWPKAEEWAVRTEKFIRQNVSDPSAAYFSAATRDFPAPIHAIDRRYVDWIYTRQRRIGVVISQLQSG